MNKPKPLMLTVRILEKEWSRYLRKNSNDIGVPDAYRHIILFLSRNPGASQKQLAEFCQMTGAAVSQIIKEMQLSGYIRKDVDEKDQRYFKLYLTTKAEENVEIIREKIYNADNFITSVISSQKEMEIVSELNNLIDAIRKEL